MASGVAPHSRCVDCRQPVWEMCCSCRSTRSGSRAHASSRPSRLCTARLAMPMIAGLPLLVALALFARAPWPSGSAARVYAASLAFGVGYTIYEWLNTGVRRGSWAYTGLMPVVPVIGTGLAPLMQWLLVPTLAQWIAVGRAPGSINVSARVEQRERENATCHRSKASWDRR